MGFWNKLRALFGMSPGGDLESPRSPARVTPEEAFTALFLDEARAHPAVERAERIPGDFAVHLFRPGTEQPWTAFLGNLFQEAREDAPDDKVLRIRRFLSTLGSTEPDLSWEEAAPRLVPLVRLATFGAGAGVTPLSRPFVPFVHVLVGVDSEHSVAIVDRARVDEWKQPPDAVFAAAIATLARHVRDDDVERYDPEAPYAIWHVTRDDSYECSRLALPGFLASFRGRVSGNPIAIVPNRSTLIVSGDGDPAAIARLARSAEAEFIASPRAVSPAVYTLTGSDLVTPLHLPREHPQHLAVERGHRVLAATCYADQKAELEKRFEAENVEIFVATLKVSEHEQTKELTTIATFAQGIPSLLPEADMIVLVTNESPTPSLTMVPWATAFELARECFERDPKLDPPRYLTLAWPRPEVLAELRARAVWQDEAT
jgi:hypothetical protein